MVIGPAGVFTVNTKNHRDSRVWVGGDTVMIGPTKLPHVRNSRFEARRAGRILSATTGVPAVVTGIVAVRCADLTIKQPPSPGVVVLSGRRVRRWLAREPHVLDEQAVSTLYEATR